MTTLVLQGRTAGRRVKLRRPSDVGLVLIITIAAAFGPIIGLSIAASAGGLGDLQHSEHAAAAGITVTATTR